MQGTAREIWVLVDDRAGNAAQALGVAEALGLPFTVKTLAYTRAAALPNLIRGCGPMGLSPASAAALVPAGGAWPLLAIAAGRRAAPPARWIRDSAARAGRATALVQIMDPGWPGREDFDLIAVPVHDRHGLAGSNVLPILGAPHRVTPERLAAARETWAGILGETEDPRIALLVGGASRKRPFTPERAAALGRRTAALARAVGGRIFLTTSRRTGRAAEDALVAALPQGSWIYRWGDPGENPYFGLLAWADAIVVTGDSMSMVSEACGAAVPVLIDAPARATAAKHARFHARLYEARRALPLSDDGEGLAAGMAGLDCLPLNSALDVARAVRDRGLV